MGATRGARLSGGMVRSAVEKLVRFRLFCQETKGSTPIKYYGLHGIQKYEIEKY